MMRMHTFRLSRVSLVLRLASNLDLQANQTFIAIQE